jgi:hypothetical protein
MEKSFCNLYYGGEVKIVASRGFFPTCDIEATTTAILLNTLQNGFSFTKEVIFNRVVTATTLLATSAAPLFCSWRDA